MGEQKAVFKGRSRAKTVFHELSNPSSSEATLPTSGKALHSAIKNNGTNNHNKYCIPIFRWFVYTYVFIHIHEGWMWTC